MVKSKKWQIVMEVCLFDCLEYADEEKHTIPLCLILATNVLHLPPTIKTF